jgi:hypothetical protein
MPTDLTTVELELVEAFFEQLTSNPPASFRAQALSGRVVEFCQQHGRKPRELTSALHQVLFPGYRGSSPGLFAIMELAGQDRVLGRASSRMGALASQQAAGDPRPADLASSTEMS